MNLVLHSEYNTFNIEFYNIFIENDSKNSLIKNISISTIVSHEFRIITFKSVQFAKQILIKYFKTCMCVCFCTKYSWNRNFLQPQ